MGKDAREAISKQIQLFEIEMEKNIETKPYDAINALSYMMLQK
jgi:hypothetical protein